MHRIHTEIGVYITLGIHSYGILKE